MSNPINTAHDEEPASNSQPRIGKWTEIGEVKITQTLFGKVKVQVITGQNDHLRNWIIALILLLVLGVASWQAWQAWRQPEVTLNVDASSSDSNNETGKQPSSQPGMNTLGPARNHIDKRLGAALPSETAAAVANPKAPAQQAQSLDASAQDRVNPAKQTSQGQPAFQPAYAPPSVKVMPDISSVAIPSEAPPGITTSPSPAGNIQTHVTPETKP